MLMWKMAVESSKVHRTAHAARPGVDSVSLHAVWLGAGLAPRSVDGALCLPLVSGLSRRARRVRPTHETALFVDMAQ